MRLPKYELGERILKITKPYMKGTDIRKLQQYLKALGFHKGSIDGIFGYDTRNAIREFQKKHSMRITGSCFHKNDRVLEKLDELFADRYLDWPGHQKNPKHTGYAPHTILPPLKFIRRLKYPLIAEIRTFGDNILVWSPGKLALLRKRGFRPVWKKNIGDIHCPSIDNNIIFIQSASKVIALTPDKGKELWAHTETTGLTAPPLTSKGKLIIASEYGLKALDQLTGKEIWANDMGIMFSLQPAADQGIVIVIDGRTVYGLDEKTGTRFWRKRLSHIAEVPPAIENEIVYIISGGNMFYALKIQNGEFLWKSMMGKGNYYSSAVRRGSLYLSSMEGVIACCKEGEILWYLELSIRATTPPIITKDNIYIGTNDGLIALNLDGKQVWESLKGKHINSIALSQYQLIAADDNSIYIFS